MNAESGAASPLPQDPRETPSFTEPFQRYVEELQDRGFIDPDAIVEAHPDIGLALVEDLETYIQLRPLGEEEADTPLGTLGDYTLHRQIGRGGMGHGRGVRGVGELDGPGRGAEGAARGSGGR